MGLIFWVQVEAIQGFAMVSPSEGLRILRCWLVARPAFCEVPLEWGREFLGFGKRPDHCVEEDTLEKGDGKLGSMCAKS